jgi:hypothetical protein
LRVSFLIDVVLIDVGASVLLLSLRVLAAAVFQEAEKNIDEALKVHGTTYEPPTFELGSLTNDKLVFSESAVSLFAGNNTSLRFRLAIGIHQITDLERGGAGPRESYR